VTSRTSACRRACSQRSISGRSRRRRGGEVGAVEVGVQDEEGVRVPERHEDVAQRLLDQRLREALGGLGRARGEQVPAQRVGALGVEHVQGSTTLPFDFDIFSPFSSTMWPSTITFLNALVAREVVQRARAPVAVAGSVSRVASACRL
jgi:hypothetical protein